MFWCRTTTALAQFNVEGELWPIFQFQEWRCSYWLLSRKVLNIYYNPVDKNHHRQHKLIPSLHKVIGLSPTGWTEWRTILLWTEFTAGTSPTSNIPWLQSSGPTFLVIRGRCNYDFPTGSTSPPPTLTWCWRRQSWSTTSSQYWRITASMSHFLRSTIIILQNNF